VLKLVEPRGNKEEKMLTYDIGVALGVPIHEFDDLRDPEAHEWRRQLVSVSELLNQSEANSASIARRCREASAKAVEMALEQLDWR